MLSCVCLQAGDASLCSVDTHYDLRALRNRSGRRLLNEGRTSKPGFPASSTSKQNVKRETAWTRMVATQEKIIQKKDRIVPNICTRLLKNARVPIQIELAEL